MKKKTGATLTLYVPNLRRNIKLMKHINSTKYINYKTFCQKLFLEINTLCSKIK